MFASLRLNIFIYYFVTVVFFVGALYYLTSFTAVTNIYILAVAFLCFIILSGIFISKLAVDPLEEYVKNLQNLSKETLHELNLPVSTIKTNTQMLQKNLSDEKSKKRLSRIENACGMLEERYNELEYMIKMQSREDVSELFSLKELVEQRVAFFRTLYPQMAFELQADETEVMSDRKGVSKVIDNIVDNGVKYSNQSQKIEIRLHKNRLAIEDFGIGMDEVELLHIFDSYYQSNSSMQGFGIGLSMVKRFCDKNSIGLSFDSQPERGTKVTLEFKQLGR